jgi:Ca2+-binding RTX toxin-like protein
MAITFNESYYLQTNPDVALAVSLRQFASGADHFNKLGANELRNPNAVFDSKYYAAQNPDVLTAVSAKTFSSVYAHYLANGLKEGRAPNASLKGFDGADYLAKNPDVATAGFTAATALQHYVQYGVDENRSFTSSTAGAVTGNVAGTTGDDTITPAGGQANTVRVEGGQQGAAGDTLVVTSGSASSFQVINLGTESGDQNQTRDNTTGSGTGAKVGPVVQGFENVDARQATINMNLTAIDRTSIGNTGSVASTITGSVLQGGTGRDTLTGNAGNDSLIGGVGNDTINGNAGNDIILGGADDDVISGGAGADTISDEAGNDTVTGDAGNDTFTVGAGTNSIDGGADNDAINVTVDQATSTTVSTISGGAGDDTITLGASVGTAASAVTAASRTSVSGGTGNDTIIASLGVETVIAGAGNDTIRINTTNLGTTDMFNGNDGQDIIQLEIPTGSGTNTFTFAPGGTTTATSQFAGFEAIALIDSSGNTNAKSYKINLTDTFVANNLVNGSFLIDARGLPGGSNLVIDFSALTAASAARFTAGAFRVLTSPSTDVRDQNNVTITAAYSVQTGNSLLSNVAAFNVYSGDTTITAGSAAAYNTDRTVNTGTGQAAYTTTGGTAETGTGTTGGTISLTAANSFVGTSFDAINATPAGSRLSSGADTVNASVFLGTATIIDQTSGDGDSLNAVLTASITPTFVSGIETLNLTTLATNTLALANVTGYSTVNFAAGTSTAVQTITGLASGVTFNVASGAFASLDSTLTTASGAVTYNLNGGTITALTDNSTGTHTINVAANTTITTLTTGALALNALNITGAGNLVVTNALAGAATIVNAGTMTGALTLTASGTASSVTGGSGADSLTGGAGADTLIGGAGNDTLSGAAGVDVIVGGTGADRIALGTGATVDNYVIDLSADVASGTTLANADTILNFSETTTGQDIVNISGVTLRSGNGTTIATTNSAGSDGTFTTAAVDLDGATVTLNSANIVVRDTSAAADASFLTQAGIDAYIAGLVANSANITTVANTNILIAVQSSVTNTNVALFQYTEGSTLTAGIQASELKLVGVFQGVNTFATDFVAASFI